MNFAFTENALVRVLRSSGIGASSCFFGCSDNGESKRRSSSSDPSSTSGSPPAWVHEMSISPSSIPSAATSGGITLALCEIFYDERFFNAESPLFFRIRVFPLVEKVHCGGRWMRPTGLAAPVLLEDYRASDFPQRCRLGLSVFPTGNALQECADWSTHPLIRTILDRDVVLRDWELRLKTISQATESSSKNASSRSLSRAEDVCAEVELPLRTFFFVASVLANSVSRPEKKGKEPTSNASDDALGNVEEALRLFLSLRFTSACEPSANVLPSARLKHCIRRISLEIGFPDTPEGHRLHTQWQQKRSSGDVLRSSRRCFSSLSSYGDPLTSSAGPTRSATSGALGDVGSLPSGYSVSPSPRPVEYRRGSVFVLPEQHSPCLEVVRPAEVEVFVEEVQEEVILYLDEEKGVQPPKEKHEENEEVVLITVEAEPWDEGSSPAANGGLQPEEQKEIVVWCELDELEKGGTTEAFQTRCTTEIYPEEERSRSRTVVFVGTEKEETEMESIPAHLTLTEKLSVSQSPSPSCHPTETTGRSWSSEKTSSRSTLVPRMTSVGTQTPLDASEEVERKVRTSSRSTETCAVSVPSTRSESLNKKETEGSMPANRPDAVQREGSSEEKVKQLPSVLPVAVQEVSTELSAKEPVESHERLRDEDSRPALLAEPKLESERSSLSLASDHDGPLTASSNQRTTTNSLTGGSLFCDSNRSSGLLDHYSRTEVPVNSSDALGGPRPSSTRREGPSSTLNVSSTLPYISLYTSSQQEEEEDGKRGGSYAGRQGVFGGCSSRLSVEEGTPWRGSSFDRDTSAVGQACSAEQSYSRTPTTQRQSSPSVSCREDIFRGSTRASSLVNRSRIRAIEEEESMRRRSVSTPSMSIGQRWSSLLDRPERRNVCITAPVNKREALWEGGSRRMESHESFARPLLRPPQKASMPICSSGLNTPLGSRPLKEASREGATMKGLYTSSLPSRRAAVSQPAEPYSTADSSFVSGLRVLQKSWRSRSMSTSLPMGNTQSYENPHHEVLVPQINTRRRSDAEWRGRDHGVRSFSDSAPLHSSPSSRWGEEAVAWGSPAPPGVLYRSRRVFPEAVESHAQDYTRSRSVSSLRKVPSSDGSTCASGSGRAKSRRSVSWADLKGRTLTAPARDNDACAPRPLSDGSYFTSSARQAGYYEPTEMVLKRRESVQCPTVRIGRYPSLPVGEDTSETSSSTSSSSGLSGEELDPLAYRFDRGYTGRCGDESESSSSSDGADDTPSRPSFRAQCLVFSSGAKHVKPRYQEKRFWIRKHNLSRSTVSMRILIARRIEKACLSKDGTANIVTQLSFTMMKPRACGVPCGASLEDARTTHSIEQVEALMPLLPLAAFSSVPVPLSSTCSKSPPIISAAKQHIEGMSRITFSSILFSAEASSAPPPVSFSFGKEAVACGSEFFRMDQIRDESLCTLLCGEEEVILVGELENMEAIKAFKALLDGGPTTLAR